MKLKELVPPLELCKLIPKGEFEDTALVWVEVEIPQENKKEWRIVNRTMPIEFCHNLKYPAPTLQEIMARLNQDYIKAGAFIRSYWGCYIIDNYGDEIAKTDDNNPATAALKLWLKLKGIEYENDSEL